MARNAKPAEDTESVESVVTLSSGRTVRVGGDKPHRLISPGRNRRPTEWDDELLHLKDKGWIEVSAKDLDDLKRIMSELRKAADFLTQEGVNGEAGIGVTRAADEENLVVEFAVHDRLARGPGSRKIDDNGEAEQVHVDQDQSA